MKRAALLVGVNDYEVMNRLQFARQDAEAFATMLREHCGFAGHDITLMTCGATGGLRAFSRFIEHALADVAGLRDLDLLVFGFWGHGFAPEPGKRFLCGVDTLENDLERTALPLEIVRAKLAQAGALDTLLVLDCCQNRPPGRSSGAAALEAGAESQLSSMARDIQVAQAARGVDRVPTVAIMNACREGQRAYEWADRGHGAFTAHLLDGMAEGMTSIAQLASFVCERTPVTVRQLHRERQVPWFTVEGRGDIRLAAKPAARPRPGSIEILEPPRLHITTRPSGATVWVNDASVGQSPVSVDLVAGEHTVHAELAGFAPWERRIRFDGVGDTEFEIALVAQAEELLAGTVREFAGGEFAWIPPGPFRMGSKMSPEQVIRIYGGEQEWAEYHTDEHPRHRVTLTKGFWLATREVTVAEFRSFVRATDYRTDAEMKGSTWTYNPKEGGWACTEGASWRRPGWRVEARQPVVSVSWNDALAYCRWLSAKTGEEYRLPTEAQWEYACRAGTDTEFWFGDRPIDGRDCLNGADETELPDGSQWEYGFPFSDGYWNVSPVGSFRANPWGLYDMHGNVLEWCADWFGNYPSGAVTDPTGPVSGQYRVVRGGSWYYNPRRCRSAYRGPKAPDYSYTILGFRVARNAFPDSTAAVPARREEHACEITSSEPEIRRDLSRPVGESGQPAAATTVPVTPKDDTLTEARIARHGKTPDHALGPGSGGNETSATAPEEVLRRREYRARKRRRRYLLFVGSVIVLGLCLITLSTLIIYSLEPEGVPTGASAPEATVQPLHVPEMVEERTAGQVDTVDLGGGETLELVWCPPGTFTMGSPESEEGRNPDEIQHEVTLTQGFWMGKYEVTQGQWQAVMGDNPSNFKGNLRLPVEMVSWNDCQEFVKKLNAQVEGGRFSLPTEAQWEYACRAGTTTPFHFGENISTDQVNYNGTATYANGPKGEFRRKTTVVGSFPANAWGLHDMHGNVLEWCQDWYGDYPASAVADPTGPTSGGIRLVRGGSWRDLGLSCCSASRNYLQPEGRDISIGFRVARTP